MNERIVNKTIEIESLVSFFVSVHEKPFYFPGEFHPFWELVYVIDGELNVSGNERIYRLKKGDIAFHKPMEFHKIWSAEGKPIHALITAFRASGTLMSVFEETVISLNDESIRAFNQLINYVETRYEREDKQYQNALYETSEQEFQIFINRMENTLLSLKGTRFAAAEKEARAENDTYRKILIELNASVYENITVEELARRCRFSVSQIKRVFAQNSDIGIHKYLLKLKVSTATRLMSKGYAVCEISRMLGFSNQNYFSTVFKRETGLAPTEFARRMKKHLELSDDK